MTMMTKVACLLGVLVVFPATAWPNGTHKRLSRSELNAAVTCTKKDKTEFKVEILADGLKGLLVRAADGESIIAQDVKTVDITAVGKAKKTVTAKVSFRNGDTESTELRATTVVGTDAGEQDRRLSLASCAHVAIETHEPPPRRPLSNATAD
jgi:hypothetical protein